MTALLAKAKAMPSSSSSSSMPLTTRSANVVARPRASLPFPRRPHLSHLPRRRRSPLVASAYGDDEDEEDATPSDGEVVSTASRTATTTATASLPSGGAPSAVAALPASSKLFEDIKRVCVVGATGRTGRKVVSRLVAEGIEVSCLVRDVSRARELIPEAASSSPSSSSSSLVTLVKGDVTQPASLPAALEGCDAVIWAAGVPSLQAMFRDPLAPLRVEAEGVANAVAVFERLSLLRSKDDDKKTNKRPRFVLISSIGADDPIAQLVFPGGVLFWKKRGEMAVQRSSVVDAVIIRPGGLRDKDDDGSGNGEEGGGVVASGPDSIGLPRLTLPRRSNKERKKDEPSSPRQRPGSISRRAVADLAVDALVVPEAAGKVVEVVSRKGAPRRGAAELFAGAKQN